jgi:hypothetical protein
MRGPNEPTPRYCFSGGMTLLPGAVAVVLIPKAITHVILTGPATLKVERFNGFDFVHGEPFDMHEGRNDVPAEMLGEFVRVEVPRETMLQLVNQNALDALANASNQPR